MKRECGLTVCLGDLINTDDSDALNRENLRCISSVLTSSALPCVCLMGNHDCEAFTADEFVSLSGLSTAPQSIETDTCVLRFLNANYDSARHAPYEPHNINWMDSYLPEEQLEALSRDVNDPGRKHFYFVHQCIDPTVDRNHIMRNADRIRSVLEKIPGACVIQGHYHPGKESIVNGVHYFTLPALCMGDTSPLFLLNTNDGSIVPINR